MSFADRTLAQIEGLPEAQKAAAMAEYDRQLKTCLADMSTAITGSQGLAMVQNALVALPFYSGNTPIKEFIQDVENFKSMFTTAEQQQAFLRGVIARLRGRAKETLQGETFASVDELVKHLKERFAPKKTYGHYIQAISTAVMGQRETIQDYYDRLRSLINSAAAAVKATFGAGAQAQIDQKPQLELLALEAFIRGVPSVYRAGLVSARPQTFAGALESAKEIARYYGMDASREPNCLNFVSNRGDYLEGSYDRRTPSPNRRASDESNLERANSPRTQRSPSPYPRVRFADRDDPKNYDRNIPHFYNKNDVNIPRTTISSEGRIIAPDALRYRQPVSILARPHSPTRDSSREYYRERTSSPGQYVESGRDARAGRYPDPGRSSAASLYTIRDSSEPSRPIFYNSSRQITPPSVYHIQPPYPRSEYQPYLAYAPPYGEVPTHYPPYYNYPPYYPYPVPTPSVHQQPPYRPPSRPQSPARSESSYSRSSTPLAIQAASNPSPTTQPKTGKESLNEQTARQNGALPSHYRQ